MTSNRTRRLLITVLIAFLIRASSSLAEEIQLVPTGDGTFSVPVVINNTVRLNFVVDTGASSLTLTPDLVMTLIRSGTLSESEVRDEERTYILADGSEVTGFTVRLKEVTIGNTTVKDVEAAVMNNLNGSLLLGQSFLAQLPGWSIDNEKGLLVLETPPGEITLKTFWREDDEFSIRAGSDWSRDKSQEGDTYSFVLMDENEGGFIGVIEVEEDSGARQLALEVLGGIKKNFKLNKEQWFEVHSSATGETIPATIFTIDMPESQTSGYVATFRYGGWSYVLMGIWDPKVWDGYPKEIFEIFESFTLHWE